MQDRKHNTNIYSKYAHICYRMGMLQSNSVFNYASMLYGQGLYNPALWVDFLFGTVACKGALAQALLQEGQTKKNIKV